MSVLILTSNLGWIQTTHYCLGRPIEASLGLQAAHLSCGMIMADGCSQKMEQKPGCSHNEFDKFSLDQPLLVSGLDFMPELMDVILPPIDVYEISSDQDQVFTLTLFRDWEEPPPKNTPLFIAYQRWLI